VDGSVVEADASRERRLPGDRLPEAWSNRESQAQPVRAYLDALDAASAPARDEPKQAAPKHLSETDPQAAWSVKTGAGRSRYETNYLVDTAHAVILDVEATPARLSQEIIAAKRMLQRTRDRLGLTPQRLAADGSYGTGPFLSWLVERGVEPHVPVLERKHQTEGKLTRDAFAFDRKRNLFVCPTGRELTYRGARYAARVYMYRSTASDCAACPERQDCTSGRVRTVVRLFDEDARDHARRLHDTPAYAQSCRERKKVEMLFAHLKRYLKLTRLRLRGLAGASEEFLLAATAQNLRKLVKLSARPTLAPSTA
jgi:hypothetical protein